MLNTTVEKIYYMMVTMPGYGVLDVVALESGCRNLRDREGL
jgi:hypothetical protein